MSVLPPFLLDLGFLRPLNEFHGLVELLDRLERAYVSFERLYRDVIDRRR